MALLLGSCLLVVSCSSETAGDSIAAPSAPPAVATSSPSESADPCDLLSVEEAATVAGEQVGKPKPGLTGGLPNCQWATSDGKFVQTISASSSEWARTLPEVIRALEASGIANDPANQDKLREAAALIKAGQQVEPGQACDLFSQMVELQGQPPGSTSIVTVIPSNEDPAAVTAQMCSGGKFTSVLVARAAGLDPPLPMEQAVNAMKLAHRRNLG